MSFNHAYEGEFYNQLGVHSIDSMHRKGRLDFSRTREGKNMLHWAVVRNDLDVVERLLSYGADVQVETEDAVGPISLAAKYGHEELLDQLVESLLEQM